MSKQKKNAIFMLLMLSESYLVGACINGLVQKYMLKKAGLNKNVDVVCMCDQYMYNYEPVLKNYFDRVVEIKLLKIKSKAYFKKYESWTEYALNKWHCLQYDEYDKIYFTDIDVLPRSIKLYDVFNIPTPAFMLRTPAWLRIDCKKGYEQFDKKRITKRNLGTKLITNHSEYNKIINSFKYSLDGGFLLIKPDISDYNNFFDWIKQLAQSGKVIPPIWTTIDETGLLYYYMVNRKQIYRICDQFCVSPGSDWYTSPKKAIYKLKSNKILSDKDKKCGMQFLKKSRKVAYSYNFISGINPWQKPLILMWKEEYIWHILAQQVTLITPVLKNINILDNLQVYKQAIDYIEGTQNKEEPVNFDHVNSVVKKFMKILDKNSDTLVIISNKAYKMNNINQKALDKYSEIIDKLDERISITERNFGYVDYNGSNMENIV